MSKGPAAAVIFLNAAGVIFAFPVLPRPSCLWSGPPREDERYTGSTGPSLDRPHERRSCHSGYSLVSSVAEYAGICCAAAKVPVLCSQHPPSPCELKALSQPCTFQTSSTTSHTTWVQRTQRYKMTGLWEPKNTGGPDGPVTTLGKCCFHGVGDVSPPRNVPVCRNPVGFGAARLRPTIISPWRNNLRSPCLCPRFPRLASSLSPASLSLASFPCLI